MLLLILDVIPQRRVIDSAHRKRSIAVLPSEIATVGEILVNPSRGVRLDGARQLGDRDGGRRFDIEMNVVSNAARAQQAATLPIEYVGCAGEEPRTPRRIQPGTAVLGCPHQMNSK